MYSQSGSRQSGFLFTSTSITCVTCLTTGTVWLSDVGSHKLCLGKSGGKLWLFTLCQRRRNLQQTETDPRRLHSLSGAWFTEECIKRHRIWSGSDLVHATIRCRRTKSRGPFSADTLFPGPWGCVTAVVGISRWSDSVVVAIVTDASLSELFGGEKDNNNSTSSEAERRLRDIKDRGSRGSVLAACHRK